MKKYIIFLLLILAFSFIGHTKAYSKPLADMEGAYSVSSMAAAGNYIAMGYFDGKVAIYNPAVSELLYILNGHSKPVDCVASDIYGKYVLSSSIDGKVILWNPATGEELYRTASPGTSFARCAVDPGGEYSIAGAGSSFSIWKNDTWENIALIEGIKEGVFSLSVHYNGKIAAVGGRNGTINLYSIPDGKLLKTLQAGKGEVESLAFAAQSDLLISGGYDNVARIWNISTGKIIKELSRHEDTVRRVGASAGGKYFVTAGDDGRVFLWNMATGQAKDYMEKNSVSVVSLAVDASLRFIAAGIGKPFDKQKFARVWFPARPYESRDIFTFAGSQVTISSSGFVTGSGNYADKITIYSGGKKLPYAKEASKYNKPERMKIDLGNGFVP